MRSLADTGLGESGRPLYAMATLLCPLFLLGVEVRSLPFALWRPGVVPGCLCALSGEWRLFEGGEGRAIRVAESPPRLLPWPRPVETRRSVVSGPLDIGFGSKDCGGVFERNGDGDEGLRWADGSDAGLESCTGFELLVEERCSVWSGSDDMAVPAFHAFPLFWRALQPSIGSHKDAGRPGVLCSSRQSASDSCCKRPDS